MYITIAFSCIAKIKEADDDDDDDDATDQS